MRWTPSPPSPAPPAPAPAASWASPPPLEATPDRRPRLAPHQRPVPLDRHLATPARRARWRRPGEVVAVPQLHLAPAGRRRGDGGGPAGAGVRLPPSSPLTAGRRARWMAVRAGLRQPGAPSRASRTCCPAGCSRRRRLSASPTSRSPPLVAHRDFTPPPGARHLPGGLQVDNRRGAPGAPGWVHIDAPPAPSPSRRWRAGVPHPRHPHGPRRPGAGLAGGGHPPGMSVARMKALLRPGPEPGARGGGRRRPLERRACWRPRQVTPVRPPSWPCCWRPPPAPPAGAAGPGAGRLPALTERARTCRGGRRLAEPGGGHPPRAREVLFASGSPAPRQAASRATTTTSTCWRRRRTGWPSSPSSTPAPPELPGPAGPAGPKGLPRRPLAVPARVRRRRPPASPSPRCTGAPGGSATRRAALVAQAST